MPGELTPALVTHCEDNADWAKLPITAYIWFRDLPAGLMIAAGIEFVDSLPYGRVKRMMRV